MIDDDRAEYEDRNVQAYMNTIDEALEAIEQFIAATTEGRKGDARHWRSVARRKWAEFGELMINRADSRTAHQVVFVLKQLDLVKAQVESIDDPTGADAGAHPHG